MTLESILQEGFAALGLKLDETALRRFRLYADFLREKNAVMNLTAIEGEADTARLHFLDCAALLCEFPMAGKRVVDVGSGAGFPGLVLKIACPEAELTLLDSLDKRVGFLRECGERLALEGLCCRHERAEQADPALRGAFDFAVSRAVARLSLLCELCLPFVKTGGRMIAMKGPDCEAELDEARRAVCLLGGEYERTLHYTIPGTEIVHSLVVIRKTGETPAKYPRPWAQMKKKSL